MNLATSPLRRNITEFDDSRRKNFIVAKFIIYKSRHCAYLTAGVAWCGAVRRERERQEKNSLESFYFLIYLRYAEIYARFATYLITL